MRGPATQGSASKENKSSLREDLHERRGCWLASSWNDAPILFLFPRWTCVKSLSEHCLCWCGAVLKEHGGSYSGAQHLFFFCSQGKEWLLFSQEKSCMWLFSFPPVRFGFGSPNLSHQQLKVPYYPHFLAFIFSSQYPVVQPCMTNNSPPQKNSIDSPLFAASIARF